MGQTDEILKLIPFLQYNKNVVIAMTGNPESTLAKHAHYHLNIAVAHEACPLDLAPTSSTTTTLVMGDALAIALINERNFKAEDYAVFHPGGGSGGACYAKVQDVMRRTTCLGAEGDDVGQCDYRHRRCAAGNRGGRRGGQTDRCDYRRGCAPGDGQIQGELFQYRSAGGDDARTPKTILPTERIVVAEEMMRNHKIHSIVVTDEQGHVVGIVEFFNVSVMG